jgi:hypothetical protein
MTRFASDKQFGFTEEGQLSLVETVTLIKANYQLNYVTLLSPEGTKGIRRVKQVTFCRVLLSRFATPEYCIPRRTKISSIPLLISPRVQWCYDTPYGLREYLIEF